MRAPFYLCLVFAVLLLLRWPASSLGLAQVAQTITVDQGGGGDYTTVQSAVDAVPDGNSQWVKIHVKQGSYREKVTISSQKGFILLEGDGSSSTDINFDLHADDTDAPGIAPITGRQHRNLTDAEISPTYKSATFTVHSENFVARNIAFKNTYNGGLPAIALLVDGDKGAFYDCAFHGYQDTLSDLAGRHYFRHCLVEGAVDFIFGYGKSIYEDCTLMSNMPASSQQPGWVTAHGRAADRSAAFVFKGGVITGSGRQYLGRAWNDQAAVVFYRVKMDGVVVSQGWDKWNSTQDVSHVSFTEVGCTGRGSGTAGRVPWEKRINYAEVQRFVDIGFIDDDGWLSNQPLLWRK